MPTPLTQGFPLPLRAQSCFRRSLCDAAASGRHLRDKIDWADRRERGEGV